ncbi:DUF4129 domain-containing protein [Prevotella sp. A2931]|uniref:DUF4129 domain-containing protein n=1 Tax=Prevotella illustrans TaxID=2800387 RepID=A0ABS3M5P8_9BACT|nr:MULTISPECIES: DUF4129 domain-containing protein [Prevotella]MBO1363440.1 DUF4129 domain-containing protein [Prevotella illustrans]PTL26347.1 DUF4129 domain-containing protein [Prevotella sp. oral taxon 820]
MLQPLTDTLTCDTLLLHRFRTDEAYNYARELQAPDQNVLQWFTRLLDRWLHDVFSISSDTDLRVFIYIALALAFVGLIGRLLWRHKLRLFSRSGAIVTPDEDEDNIYGVDFDGELARAMARKDYYRAVRMVYLRTLRHLADLKKIDWQLYKTPTRYAHEYPVADFRRMTHCFTRVRYGNYPADATLVETLLRYENAIRQEGERA